MFWSPSVGSGNPLLDLPFPLWDKKQTWQEFEWLSKCPLGCPLGMAVISFTSCFICCILVGEMAWDLRHELKCVADAGICYTWPNPPHIFPCHQSLICSIVLLRCVQIYHFSEIAWFTLCPLEYFPLSSNSSNFLQCLPFSVYRLYLCVCHSDTFLVR